MDQAVWVNTLLERVVESGEEGKAALDFIRARRTQIGIKRARSNVGAFWTVFGNIRLNSHYYTYDTLQ